MSPATTIRTLLLFFHLAVFDDREAKSLTRRAYRRLRQDIERQKPKSSKAEPELIFAEEDIVNIATRLAARSKKRQAMPTTLLSSDLTLPANLHLGPWQDVRRRARFEEYISLVWSHVLKVPEEKIAAGLGLSPGTVRYRAGRSLRLLGGILQGETPH